MITVISSVIVTSSTSRKGVTRMFYKSEMGTVGHPTVELEFELEGCECLE